MGIENGTKWIGALALALTLLSNGLIAQPNVKVKGYVNAPEEIKAPVNITVKNSEGEVVWEKTKRHPGLKFKVPVNEVYNLTFEQPGTLTKTVQLDTRHAVRPFTKKQTRPVNFEVIMEAADEDSIRYAGPVGKIDFKEYNGRMDVAYDYDMETIAEHSGNRTATRSRKNIQ